MCFEPECDDAGSVEVTRSNVQLAPTQPRRGVPMWVFVVFAVCYVLMAIVGVDAIRDRDALRAEVRDLNKQLFRHERAVDGVK